MILNHSEKKFHCPPNALIHPSLFRIIYVPVGLFACWAATFFKARAVETWPWFALLLVTIFVLGILAAEALISAYFPQYLAPAIFGFLVGTVVNVIIQGLLGKFQGLTWAFQTPIQFSLGAVLFGFLGALIFISYSQKVRKIFSTLTITESQGENKSLIRVFSIIIWVVAITAALALYVNIITIQREFRELETDNPLRKPLWFSAGAIILVLVIVVLKRKNLLQLGLILFPGVTAGLVWAYLVRNMFEAVYIAYPKFPIASEVLEVLLVLNFCFLGIAWLNKAACYGY